jgi:hypothetical protein
MSKENASTISGCRAEFIFYAQTGDAVPRPEKIFGDYNCDCQRPDWESRWRDWSTRQNPYLNLFLCADHARKLHLIE